MRAVPSASTVRRPVRFSVRRWVLGIAVLVAAAAPAPAQECWVPGDADLDGTLNLSDAIRILSPLRGSPACGAWQGDANRDGEVDLSDALTILGVAFLGEISLYTEPVCEPAAPRGEPELDPAFAIGLEAPRIVGDTVERRLHYRSSAPLRGLQIHFTLPGNLAPLDPAFDLDAALSVQQTTVGWSESSGRVLTIAAFQLTLPEPAFAPTGGAWAPLGTLRCRIDDLHGPMEAVWTPVVALDGCVARSHFVAVEGGSGTVKRPVGAEAVETAPPVGFQRGAIDAAALRAYFLGEGAAPLDCQGNVEPDVADINDNEFLTVADLLRLRHATLSGGAVPAPGAGCGADPDEGRQGFDALDGSYQLTATEVISVRPEGGRVEAVHIPIAVDSPTDVAGAQFVVEYDAGALTPFGEDEGGAFKATGADVAVRVAEEGGRGLLLVVVSARVDGEAIRQAAPGIFVQLGTLRFHLRDFAVFEPLRWRAEAQIGERTYRASIVDRDFADHHPDLVAGEYRFVRGNSNSDTAVDISDAQFTFDFLFKGGRAPHCLDAADANSDGAIDISDGIFTLSYLFLGGETFPRPFPQCGLGVLIDELGCSAPPPGDACAR